MHVNAYDKPYFSQIGYYPMYLLPPGQSRGRLRRLERAEKGNRTPSR